MSKVQAQAGSSLADIYDVKGSIAGIENLETRDLPIVHEMGATVFSERLSGNHRRQVTASLAQSTAFDSVLADFGQGNAQRILGVTVLADFSARVDRVMVAIQDPIAEREVPIFVWDTANDATSVIRIVDNGAAAADMAYFIPNPLILPNMLLGPGQPDQMPNIVLRGQTSAFGAGAVVLTLLIYHVFAELGGVSSHGLPVPSW